MNLHCSPITFQHDHIWHLPAYFPLDRVWSVSESSASGSLEGLFQDPTEMQVGEITPLNALTCLRIKPPTHQNGICCGTRREFCCTSGGNHRATPCMSTGDGVACPRWPKTPLYILSRRQGCGLDLCRPNIHLVQVRRCCILLLRSSSIWFGKFLTCLCSKRVNILTCWHVCGSLGKCAADSVQCDILLQTRITWLITCH